MTAEYSRYISGIAPQSSSGRQEKALGKTEFRSGKSKTCSTGEGGLQVYIDWKKTECQKLIPASPPSDTVRCNCLRGVSLIQARSKLTRQQLRTFKSCCVTEGWRNALWNRGRRELSHPLLSRFPPTRAGLLGCRQAPLLPCSV